MALTPQQAALAGQLAAQLALLQQALAEAQQAIAQGVTLQSYSATGYLNGVSVPLYCAVPMNVTDSTNILNALIISYQNNISSINNQLAAM